MDFLASLEGSAFSVWVREGGSMWGYPGILTLHTLGLAMLVGSSLVIDLCLLGKVPGLPLTRLDGFFRMIWAGFVVNALSGAILFAADAVKKAGQPIFYIKLGLIGLALISMMRIRKEMTAGEAIGSGNVSKHMRVLAVASLVLWACAITAGRLMAYLNNEPPRIL